jgi:ABC-type lipoprotein export system ATPase subunit
MYSQTLGNTKEVIKYGQSGETGNIRYRRRNKAQIEHFTFIFQITSYFTNMNILQFVLLDLMCENRLRR